MMMVIGLIRYKGYLMLSGILILAVLLLPRAVSATGMPVYCFGCEEATRGSAKLIGTQIKLQTRALVEALDGVGISRNNLELARSSLESKRDNAKTYDPKLGGIPRDTCALASIGKVKTSSRKSQLVDSYNLAVGAKIHGESTSEIAPTDDPEFHTAKKIVTNAMVQDSVIRRVGRGDLPGLAGIAVTADALNEPITIPDSGSMINGKSTYETALGLEWLRLDPNPPRLNPALKMENAEIADAGSPAAVKTHARNVAYNNTNEVAKSVINTLFKDRKNSLDGSIALKLAEANGFDYSDQVLDGKISPAAMRYLLNTYRINSTGEFIEQNDAGNPIALAKISNKISAQSLSNEEIIIQKLEQNNRVQAHILSTMNQINYALKTPSSQ